MSITSILSSVFGGGAAINSIEKVALEWIQTDIESAEADCLKIKALDPNGKMRRDQSNNVGQMYKFYLAMTSFMLVFELFYSIGVGHSLSPEDYVLVALNNTTEKMTDLFIPITTLYGLIVGASFGVNYNNVKNGK